MDRTGDERLAGPGLTRHQHREVGIHDPGDQPVKLLHGGRPANEWQVVSALVLGFRPDCRRAPLYLERAARPFHQVGKIEGLRQIIIGIRLGCLNRRHDGVLRRDHDHRQTGPQFGDLGKLIEAVPVRHDHVGNHEIAFAFLDPAHQRDQRRGRMNLAARAGQRLRQNRADRAVVIGDKNRAVH